jgi:hypothetical protein
MIQVGQRTEPRHRFRYRYRYRVHENERVKAQKHMQRFAGSHWQLQPSRHIYWQKRTRQIQTHVPCTKTGTGTGTELTLFSPFFKQTNANTPLYYLGIPVGTDGTLRYLIILFFICLTLYWTMMPKFSLGVWSGMSVLLARFVSSCFSWPSRAANR